jgi:large subunit ribosomal protein L25
MTSMILHAKPREITGKKTRKLRDNGLIPAVLYGKGMTNKNLAIKKNEFLKVYNEVGSSGLIDLQIGEQKPVKILIHDYQNNPETDEIIHADLYQITEGSKITTHVELELVGEAPAVKELGGILVKNMDEIEIECLPKDLEKIDTIKVDLSSLNAFDTAIHIKDLAIPEGVKVLANPDEVVVLVSEPEEEKVEVPVAVEAAQPELVGEEGKAAEGDEPKSGAETKEASVNKEKK